MSNKIFKIKNGFTLLEVIIAVFIIAVGVAGVAKIMPSLIVDSSVNQSRLVAAYLAQEGIEIVRNIRDTNWLENQYGGSPVAWDDGFSPCISANGGCDIDYYGVAAPPIIHPFSGTGLKLAITPSPAGYNHSFGNDTTKFVRKITIDKNATNDILTVTVNVSWDDRGKHYDFPVQDKLYKWY